MFSVTITGFLFKLQSFYVLLTVIFGFMPYPENVCWLIEISNSTLQFDLTTKASIYARNGIREYWIVDLINKKLIVHTAPQGNIYQNISTHQTGTICSQAFPNAAIALEKLLF